MGGTSAAAFPPHPDLPPPGGKGLKRVLTMRRKVAPCGADSYIGISEYLCRAAHENHVKHFILISALWADRDLWPVIFRVKRRAMDAYSMA